MTLQDLINELQDIKLEAVQEKITKEQTIEKAKKRMKEYIAEWES